LGELGGEKQMRGGWALDARRSASGEKEKEAWRWRIRCRWRRRPLRAGMLGGARMREPGRGGGWGREGKWEEERAEGGRRMGMVTDAKHM